MQKLLPLLFLFIPWSLFAQGREVENLAAFARLLGAVRLFHPSDAGAAADIAEGRDEGVERAVAVVLR
jgi:hypothetical protein